MTYTLRAAFWFLVWLVVRAYTILARRPFVVLTDDGKGWAESAAELEARGLEPYVTRWFLSTKPAPGKTSIEGWMLHYFHRPDYDRRLHNHPYSWALSRVLRGGYIERRAYVYANEVTADPGTEKYLVRHVGDRIGFSEYVFHRITGVAPNTWTLFRAGPRHGRGWRFL